MFKVIMCLVIVFSSGVVGFSLSNKLSKRKEILEMFSLELNSCATRIRYSSDTLARIFSHRFNDYVFSDEKSFYIQWSEVVKLYEKYLIKDDVELLKSFAQNLGTADIETEIGNINMYIEMLKSNISDAHECITKKSKLYRVLSLSAGLMVSILLI